MHFESWSAFWQMGGYGFYVWLSFSVTLGTMVLLVVEARYARKKLRGQVLAEVARKERIQKHKSVRPEDSSQQKTLQEGSQ